MTLNLNRLGLLLRLRYRLLWANVRFRNGKIALFLAVYLTAILVIVLLSMGGFGAGVAAIRTGKAELVARIVTGGFFVNFLLVSITLGVGMNATFSDAALRRYPLSAFERVVARQGLAFLEPLWMFALALYGGLAAGLYVAGVGSFWPAAAGALLLAMSNYLLARVVLTTIARVMVRRGGALVLLVVLMAVCIGPSLFVESLVRNRGASEAALAVLQFTPPFAAAAAMVQGQASAWLPALASLALWCWALSGALALLERMRETPKAAARQAFSWDGPCDAIGRLFGPRQAPLVSKVLRYYFRNNRVRINLLAAVPLLVMLIVTQRGAHGPESKFLMALPLIAVLGFAATFSMSVNVFGYDAEGFRRYLLLPVAPAGLIRAAIVPPLLIGGVLIPPALAFWLAFAPGHTDARMFTMLLSSAAGGLLLFNGLAVWTTLLAPRKTAFASNFGNNLSLGGNVLVMGGFLGGMVAGNLLAEFGNFAAVTAFWWAAPLFTVLGAAFFSWTLRKAPDVLWTRRERLLAVLEGRR